EPTASVRQYDRATAGGGRGPYGVHDGADTAAFVQVGPAEEDQQTAVAEPNRAHRATVAGDGRSREAGQIRGGQLCGRLTERIGRGKPTRPHDEGDVVVGAGRLAKPFGGGVRGGVRVASFIRSCHGRPA